MPDRASRLERAGLTALLLGALALRLWGTGFGLPFTYHPDEHQYVDTAIAVLGGDLDPGRFNNPSLFKYALAVVDGLWLVASGATGGPASPTELAQRVRSDPSGAYRLARGTVAVLGAATVLVVWALGRRVHDRRAAMAAAAIFAVAFLHVRESHFAVGDVPATLLATLALLAGVRLLRGGTTRDYLVAGAWVGLAAGTKYTGALAAVSVGLAHVMAEDAPLAAMPRRLLDRRLWLAAAAAMVAFLAAVPYAAANWPAFSADVALLAERGRIGFKGLALSPDPGWRFYLSALDWGMGRPFLVAAVLGLAAGLAGRRRPEVILACSALCLYAYLSPQLLLFERFILPALPPLAVLIGSLLVRLADRLERRWNRRASATMLALAVAAIAACPLARSLRFDWLLTRTDTRTLARAWIEENLPVGSRIVVQSNGPELAPADLGTANDGHPFEVQVVGTTELEERPVEALADQGVDFVVVSSFSTDRRLLDPVADAERRDYYAGLDRALPRLQEFLPYRGSAPPFLFAQVYGPATDLWRFERPGPAIRVYRAR